MYPQSIALPAARIAATLKQYDQILVAAHGSPDGDAVGATGAMGYLLKAMGKHVALYNSTGIPDYLAWVPLPGRVETKLIQLPFQPNLIVSLDCGDVWRLGKELSPLVPASSLINIDHHLGNPEFGTVDNWVDPTMAATGQMVAAIADMAGIPLSGNLGVCVYLALVTDTGSFAHGNTNAEVFELAARLMREGLDATFVRERLENQWSLPKTRLWGYLMGKIALEAKGQLAICSVSLEEIAEYGAVREDLEGFPDQLRRIKGVRVALLIRQDPGKTIKFSLRSSGNDDVRTVAASFGGGGHLNASGATVNEQTLDNVKQQLIRMIQDTVL